MKVGNDDTSRKAAFSKLSQGHQAIIEQLLDYHQSTTAQVKGAILSTESRLAIRLNAQDIQLSEAAARQKAQSASFLDDQLDECKRRVLKALSFPEMKERQNMIESRVNDFGHTCRWIFSRPSPARTDHTVLRHNSEDEEDEEDGSTDNFDSVSNGAKGRYPSEIDRRNLFAEWLETDDDPYWISGKPGFGKSSVMSDIFPSLEQEVDDLPLFRKWAYPQGPCMIAFWVFRPASSSLLKSLHGFWRTVCFRVLDTDSSLPHVVRQNLDGTAPSTLRSCLTPGGSSAKTWTNRELETWAQYLLHHSSLKYFLLVDGLDEIEGDRAQLLEAINSMSFQHDNLKICSASRPESPFVEALDLHAGLGLHKINYHDIYEACKLQLNGTKAETFVKRISENSQVSSYGPALSLEISPEPRNGARPLAILRQGSRIFQKKWTTCLIRCSGEWMHTIEGGRSLICVSSNSQQAVA